MEAIRTTMNSARLAPIIDLPAALRDWEVEVIVLPEATNNLYNNTPYASIPHQSCH